MLESLIRWCGEKIENEAALPFHEAAAEKYGKICADLHRKGTPIGTMDMPDTQRRRSVFVMLSDIFLVCQGLPFPMILKHSLYFIRCMPHSSSSS